MPIVNHRPTAPGPDGKPILILPHSGPRIAISLQPHPGLVQALSDRGKPIPPAVSGVALIDTGATITSIDQAAAEQMQLAPNGVATMGTAGGKVQQDLFAFQGVAEGKIPFTCDQGAGCDLSGQGIILLFGMDLLAQCILVVNGPDGSYSLSV